MYLWFFMLSVFSELSELRFFSVLCSSIEMYVDVLFSLFFSGSTSKAFHNCASLVNVFTQFTPWMCRMTNETSTLDWQWLGWNIHWRWCDEPENQEIWWKWRKIFIRHCQSSYRWIIKKFEIQFFASKSSKNFKKKFSSPREISNFLIRSSFLVNFDIFSKKSEANANLKEERKMLISCFDGYEKKNIFFCLILWCRGRIFLLFFLTQSQTLRCACVKIFFTSQQNFFLSFFQWTSLTSWTTTTTTRNVFVCCREESLECSNVTRKKKIEIEQVPRHS